jgi:hypothetical protein
MAIKQLRLETANVSGKLSNLSDLLGKHGVTSGLYRWTGRLPKSLPFA